MGGSIRSSCRGSSLASGCMRPLPEAERRQQTQSALVAYTHPTHTLAIKAFTMKSPSCRPTPIAKHNNQSLQHTRTVRAAQPCHATRRCGRVEQPRSYYALTTEQTRRSLHKSDNEQKRQNAIVLFALFPVAINEPPPHNVGLSSRIICRKKSATNAQEGQSFTMRTHRPRTLRRAQRTIPCVWPSRAFDILASSSVASCSDCTLISLHCRRRRTRCRWRHSHRRLRPPTQPPSGFADR